MAEGAPLTGFGSESVLTLSDLRRPAPVLQGWESHWNWDICDVYCHEVTLYHLRPTSSAQTGKKKKTNWFHLKTRDLFGIKPLWSFTFKHGYVTILTDKSRMWDYWDLENIVLNGIIMLMNEFLWWQHLLCLIYLLRFPFNVVNIHNMT